MTDELDFEIQTLFRRVADAAPPAPDLDGWPTPSPAKRRPRIAVMSAAVAIAMVGVAGVVIVAGREGGEQPASTTPSASRVSVDYERLLYRQTADLPCTDPIVSSPDAFSRATIEVFADRTGERWANKVTYPDGSHRELIATGDAFYPDELAERGDQRGAVVGCHYGNDDLILAAEPAQGDFYSLNPLDDIPTLNGESMVPGYRDLGTLVVGETREVALGTAEVWRERIDGFWGFGEQRNVPGTQITEWYVEPGSGRVLKWRFTTTIEGVGTATATVTLIETGGTVQSDELFDDTGYRRLPIPERPTVEDSDTQETVAPTTPSAVTVDRICDTYTVRAGDYSVGIAERFGITLELLMAANPGFDRNNFFSVGDVLAIPCP